MATKKSKQPSDQAKADALGRLLMREELAELAELRELAAAVVEYDRAYPGDVTSEMVIDAETWRAWLGIAAKVPKNGAPTRN